MSLLSFLRRGQPDGAAPMLEAIATGIEPALLDGLTVPTAAGRRDRTVDTASDFVAEALGTKLLNAWLQNRHQTLMPLSLNLAIMAPPQQDAFARILASLVLAGRTAAEASEAIPALRSWFAGLGASEAALAQFDQALGSPLPLNVIFETAQAEQLTIYTYVAALMASDTRYPVSVMLCDMIQARFDLPTAAVRSAVRRYRR